MLHKGKLIKDLEKKKAAFQSFDTTFGEQIQIFRAQLNMFSQRFNSSQAIQAGLEVSPHTTSRGALPTADYDIWYATKGNEEQPPLYRFPEIFHNHEEARGWAAKTIEGTTTIAVDGSQLAPWKDASVPVALVQASIFKNPHQLHSEYIKDIQMEVLSPEDLRDTANEELEDFYPFSEGKVHLQRFLLETDTVCRQIEQLAAERSADGTHALPIVFFDGSLIVSFATKMPPIYRDNYVTGAIRMLECSKEYHIPLIGYVDNSYARDITMMLTHLFPDLPPQARGVYDAQLYHRSLHWGDVTPAMICAREDVLNLYGTWKQDICFSYLQTTGPATPARIEFPLWMLEDNVLPQVLDVIRAEVIAGNGYPYALETADATAVITIEDRAAFYTTFQQFIEKQGIPFTIATKSQSKMRRR